MTKDQFLNFIKNPNALDTTSSVLLADVLNDYPYFQTAHLLYLKSLYNSKSTKYTQQLKVAATYANDRKKLYELVMQEDLQQKIKLSEKSTEMDQKLKQNDTSIEKQILEEAVNASITLEVENNKKTDTQSYELKEIDSKKPKETNISKTGKKLFREWLYMHRDSDASKKPNTPDISSTIIDKFIKDNPSISRNTNEDKSDKEKTTQNAEFFSPTNTARLSIIDQEDFVTETLANIYEKQGYLNKAIKAFETLSLKNPEKSDTFAARIEKIKRKI